MTKHPDPKHAFQICLSKKPKMVPCVFFRTHPKKNQASYQVKVYFILVVDQEIPQMAKSAARLISHPQLVTLRRNVYPHLLRPRATLLYAGRG